MTGLNPLSKTRKREYIELRAILYTLLRDNLYMTYPQIAQVFNKNHATIIHGQKEYPYMVRYNPQMANLKQKIELYWLSKEDYSEEKERNLKIKHLQEQNFLLNLEITELKNKLKLIDNGKKKKKMQI